jgi:hypothetical protein
MVGTAARDYPDRRWMGERFEGFEIVMMDGTAFRLQAAGAWAGLEATPRRDDLLRDSDVADAIGTRAAD